VIDLFKQALAMIFVQPLRVQHAPQQRFGQARVMSSLAQVSDPCALFRDCHATLHNVPVAHVEVAFQL
jgi:hypothetical protein